MFKVKIHNKNSIAEYPFTPGVNLLNFLRENGYEISADCGGNGKCGKCGVRLAESGVERIALACKTVLNESCEIYLKAHSDDISWNEAVCSELEVNERQGIGAAVDLGTTTVAVALYELSTGREMGTLSRWNMQKSYGGDVISRISHCMDAPNGLEELSAGIREQVSDMLGALCEKVKVDISEVKEIFLAGNTVMEHIFAGISPNSIAAAPYTPESLFDNGDKIMLGDIPVYLSPCVAGYVGGDIAAGMLACGINNYEGKALFIDIGTNGEMALGGRYGIISCAVASGPAFEGAGISCGMPATRGAITHAQFNEDTRNFDCETVGNTTPAGICGSGLLDIVAGLLEHEFIDESGYLENDEGENVFFITDTVFLSQRDVRQLQLAKAAVAAGIERLMETEGVSYDEIDALYLAGGFGIRLNGESAVRIGMMPRELLGKIKPLGNTSLNGAAAALLSIEKRQELLKIKANCRYLELSSDKKFNDSYIENMGFEEYTI